MQYKKHNLDPKLDVVFKSMFTRKGNEELLEDLLSSILNRDVKCKEVVKEARVGQKRPEEKYGALDIKAILGTGEEVDIELQLINKHDTVNRATYYLSVLTAEGLSVSEDYSSMKQKIVIFILDYILFNNRKAINESHICLKEENNYELTNLHKYYFIELPKIDTIKDEEIQKLREWYAFLNQKEELVKIVRKNKVIKRAQEELEYLSGEEEIKRLAELRQKAIRDEIALKRYAEEGMKKAMEEGHQKGIKQGIEQGVQEGIKNTAIRLIEKGVDMQIISEVTGFTIEQLQNIKNK